MKNEKENPDGYLVKKIDITDVDMFGSGKIGFVKLKADIKVEGEKKSLPGRYMTIMTLQLPLVTGF